MVSAELNKREDCKIPKYELIALAAVLEFNLGLKEEARQMLVLPTESPI